jgi:hypothetical protein
LTEALARNLLKQERIRRTYYRNEQKGDGVERIQGFAIFVKKWTSWTEFKVKVTQIERFAIAEIV